MLEAHDLGLRYGETWALRDVSATVLPKEVVAVTGPSGSGKTSLLYCLSGLIAATQGRVVFDGVDVTAMRPEARAELRRRSFGFVFQFAELVPEFTLRENIALPLELLKVRPAERRRRVDHLVEVLALTESVGRRPAEVSGGQAQRAAVARALIHRPAVLFADEPTGSLDSENGAVVLAQLLRLAQDDGAAVILVTHDPAVAAHAETQMPMRDGSRPLPAC